MKRFLMFVLCLFSGWAQAETTPLALIKTDLCHAGYQLYHINGIFTDQASATANLTKLGQTYGNTHEGHVVIYRLAYNQTRNMLDLVDSFNQVALQFPGVTFSDWLYAVWTGVIGGTVTSNAVVQAIAIKMGGDLDRPSPYQDGDLTAIQAAFNASYKPGARALIVGHSQGTLYANLLYDRLITQTIKPPVPAPSLGLVFIAAATSNIHGGGGYVTGTNDWVINTARRIGDKNTLKGTIFNAFLPDTIGHNLIQVYLNPQNVLSVSTIYGLISSGFNKLKSGYPYGQRPRATYPHAAVQWNNCGPGSGNPYNCWFTPTGGTPQLKVVPYYTYWVAGEISLTAIYTQTAVAVDGSLGAAEAAARSNAATCQSAAAAEHNRQLMLGQSPRYWVKGCFPYYGAPGPWEAMHADTMAVRTSTGQPGWSVGVNGFVDPICNII